MPMQEIIQNNITKNITIDDASYRRAEQFFPWNLHHHVFNSTLFPYWTEHALYYFKKNKKSISLVKIDF